MGVQIDNLIKNSVGANVYEKLWNNWMCVPLIIIRVDSNLCCLYILNYL